MQKLHDETSETGTASDVERMPRPPARPEPIAAHRSAAPPSASPNGHPFYAHHDRVSAAHTEFLRNQERVHLEFLAHRKRLLEWLDEAGRHVENTSEEHGTPVPEWSPPVAVAALAPMPAVVTHAPSTPTAKPERLTVTVGWGDALLDSHVAPLAVVFSGLTRIVSEGRLGPTDAHFGVLDLEFRGLGQLAGPGESITSDLVVSPHVTGAAEIPFHLSAQVARTGHGDQPLVELRGVRSSHAPSAQPHPRGPTAGAPVRTHVSRTWTAKRKFNEREVAALYEGEIFSTFGAGFERAGSHTRTPPLPGGAVLRLSNVSAFDPAGGPWSMGSVSAQAVPGVGDPLIPDDSGLRIGRVFQGAQQVLALFVMAAGGTIARDGWRFEASVDHASHLRFFAAPRPDATLEYELVVEVLEAGPWSKIVGDVKAWADGQLVMNAERLSLQLVPDFPLTSNRALYADGQADHLSGRPAADIDGFRLDYASMVAGAVGRPTDAFNQAGAFFETGERQMPRLPGPPYHFVTRVTHVAGERLSMRPGAEATMEYDVPVDAWYFDENGNRSMPWCVLLEAALQPCGWLSVYVGCPIVASENVFFRNLDGAGKMTGEVFGGSTVRTHTKVTSVSSVSGIILVSYKIECHVGDREVCNLTAAFGYFPNVALDAQAGLPTKPEQRTRLLVESPVRFDLTERPEKYCAGPLRLPGPMLLMIDEVTGFWREEGPAGKGRLRVEKAVKPREWYFKSHFYSDPVQPGSLGVEQMLQALQFYVIEENLQAGIEKPYFEPLVLDSHISWKFRGQVRPENKHIVSEVDIISVESTPDGVTVLANGSLWVDGVRCYEAKAIGVRVRGHRDVLALPPRVVETVLDPAVDAWVTDHRPSYTVPVMPMMSMVDRLASAALDHVRASYPRVDGAPEWVVVAGHELRALGWLICDRPKHLRTEVRAVLARAVHRTEEVDVLASLYDVGDDGTAKRVASGRIRVARGFATPPAAWPPLEDGAPAANPYTSGSIFWGPKLQVLRKLSMSRRGASADLDAAGADAPIGVIHHILLDGALHGVPHDELELWSDKISPGHMGVPVRLTARFFGPPPSKGTVRAEVRFAGFDGANAFPTYLIQMIGPDGRVWATLRHVEMLIPFGHRALSKADRIPFLVERRYQANTGLSEFHADRTTLRASDVKRMDGLPGSVAHVYGLERDASIDNRVIAIKDHVGQLAKVHPGNVQVDATLSEAWTDANPAKRFRVAVEQDGGDVTVRDATP
jgi:3-hydroxymyristoyl/3-hydroxydecanoyl-(acyl carrier protein) dehydratase